MHFFHSLRSMHFLQLIEYLSSLGTAATFLYGVYRQLHRAVTAIVEAKNAFVTMIEQHHEMYGWYATEIKPKRKANGSGVVI